MKYKRIYLDTETTGLDVRLHRVHQVAGIITDHRGSILEKFDLKFVPSSFENITAEAITKCRISVEELKARPLSHVEAHKEFCRILGRHCNKYDKTDKMHLLGYNVSFDADFVRAWFLECSDNYFGSWFWTPAIDIASVSAWLLGDARGNIPNVKLGTVCKLAGIDFNEENAHDGLFDVSKTYELDQFLRNNFTHENS